MATIVDRPRSALSESPVTLQPRRMPSVVEIIDVDELDEPSSSNLSRSSPYNTPGSFQQDTIVVLDSDEEDHSEGNSSNRPVHRRRLNSPPPPRAGPSRIPPVPPVPRRYSSYTSLRRPQRPPAAPSPPVVRPIAEPLAFEANLRSSPPANLNALHSHPNRHRRIAYADAQAEPQPHHVPTLGFGGALISLNRSRADDRQRQAPMHNDFNNPLGQPGFFARAENTMRRIYAAFSRGRGTAVDEEDYPEMQTMLARDLGLDMAGMDHPVLQEVLYRNTDHLRQRQQEAVYVTNYTHPEPPEPGFTYDFAKPEPLPSVQPKPPPIVIDLVDPDNANAASSSSKPASRSPPSIHTLLVCAKCLDPLVLGGGLVGEERTKRKIWSLRCGHMIDGKCLDIIGVPDSDARLKDEPKSSQNSSTDKGKGKARAYEDVVPPPPPPPASLDNSIRSRLRSRVPPPPMPRTPSPSTSTSVVAPESPRSTTLGKRKRSLHNKPRIEATHEWRCPVGGCGRVHVSVKMDGVWMPEPPHVTHGDRKGKGKWVAARDQGAAGRGAVAVFV